MSYKINAKKIADYDNCTKYDLTLENNNEEIVSQVLTVSNWQVNDGGLKDRIRQWAQKRSPEDIKKENISVDIIEMIS